MTNCCMFKKEKYNNRRYSKSFASTYIKTYIFAIFFENEENPRSFYQRRFRDSQTPLPFDLPRWKKLYIVNRVGGMAFWRDATVDQITCS